MLTNMHMHVIHFSMDKYPDINVDLNIFNTLYLFDSETLHLIRTNRDCQNKVLYVIYIIYIDICLLRFIIVHVIIHVSTCHLLNAYQFLRIQKLYSWSLYYYSNYYNINDYTICTDSIDGDNYDRLRLLIYYVFLPFYHSLHVSVFLYCCYHNIYEIPYFVLENIAFISIIIKLRNMTIVIVLLAFHYFYLKYRMLCCRFCGIFSAFFSVIIANYYECESLLFKQISWSIRNNTKILPTLEHYLKSNMSYYLQIINIRNYFPIRVCFIYWSMIMNYNMRRQCSSNKYCATGNNNCLYFYRYLIDNVFSIHLHITRHILVKVYCSYICVIFIHYCKGLIIIRVWVDYFIYLLTFSDIT